MARILVLGGGFSGVVAAESLSQQLSDEHEITLISRGRRFVFYPGLVRLAFGKCEPDDVSFDLRKSMLDRRVSFIQAEVARIDTDAREVILAHGEVAGRIPYDYLIFALGRRLATERVSGFFEHAHHLLDTDGALKFGEAVRGFVGGRAIVGQCAEAKLPVPVYETAFAFAKAGRENRIERTRLTVIAPGSLAAEFGDAQIAETLARVLEKQGIEYISDFPIANIGPATVATAGGKELDYNLLMLLPPFAGSPAVSHLGLTNEKGFINVDWTMKAIGAERFYAAGDCINFDGPKMGHMAVQQAGVVAANVAAEIAGREPVAHYQHELKTIIETDEEGIYFQKDLWADTPASIRHGRFWNWAKRVHERFWEATHT